MDYIYIPDFFGLEFWTKIRRVSVNLRIFWPRRRPSTASTPSAGGWRGRRAPPRRRRRGRGMEYRSKLVLAPMVRVVCSAPPSLLQSCFLFYTFYTLSTCSSSCVVCFFFFCCCDGFLFVWSICCDYGVEIFYWKISDDWLSSGRQMCWLGFWMKVVCIEELRCWIFFFFGWVIICIVMFPFWGEKKAIVLFVKKKKVDYFMCIGKLWMIKHICWGFGWSLCASKSKIARFIFVIDVW